MPGHLSDEDDFEPTQEVGCEVAHVYPVRRTRGDGRATRSLFLPGGALDSQTSDTQYLIGLASDTVEAETRYRDIGVGTESIAGLSWNAQDCARLQDENDVLKCDNARLQTIRNALEHQLEEVRAVVNRMDDALDPFEESQVTLASWSPAVKLSPRLSYTSESARRRSDDYELEEERPKKAGRWE